MDIFSTSISFLPVGNENKAETEKSELRKEN